MALAYGPWGGFGMPPGMSGGMPQGMGAGMPTAMPPMYGGTATFSPMWWGSPTGWTDLDLYDYNNNLVLDDDEIADIVADNIHLDPFIPISDERNIQVDVKNGVVTLSGTVRNPRVKPLAYADAFWSSGVRDVIDNIQVQPHERRQQPQQEAGAERQEAGGTGQRQKGGSRQQEKEGATRSVGR
jgi:hypothetical protein